MPNGDRELLDAAVIITRLESSIGADRTVADHDAVSLALTWIIQHTDRGERQASPWSLVEGFCRTSPLAGALAFGFYVFGK